MVKYFIFLLSSDSHFPYLNNYLGIDSVLKSYYGKYFDYIIFFCNISPVRFHKAQSEFLIIAAPFLWLLH